MSVVEQVPSHGFYFFPFGTYQIVLSCAKLLSWLSNCIKVLGMSVLRSQGPADRRDCHVPVDAHIKIKSEDMGLRPGYLTV